MRTTIIFDNIGPYHEARLRAAAKVSELTALQVTARSAEYAWENEIRHDGFKLLTLFQVGTERLEMKRELGRNMNRALDKSAPQVVFVPGWASPAALAALSWCVSRGIPAIVMSESTARDEKRSWPKERIKRCLIRMFSGALVGGTPHREYVVQLGMSPDRVCLGYDAVDNAYFRLSAEKIRSGDPDPDASETSPVNYFLASARFIEKKNLSRLLQAYARYRMACWQLREDTPAAGLPVPWDLVLLGDGPLRKSLLAQISKLDLEGHVRLPGFIQYPGLPAYYAKAGAFIHASTTEQWGLVVNEAMASGLPVLASNRCGCAADFIRDGRNGFSFNPFDSNDLGSLMKRVSFMDADARSAMGTESERIVAEWGPERFADGVSRLSQMVLSTPSPNPGGLERLLLRGLLFR